MFVITQAMIDAGNRVVELATDAEIIQSFNGLGGGLTVAEAPPEIAQWFDNDREVSDIIFEAMDALADVPFGGAPCPSMIVAGDRVMEMLIMARLAESCINANPAMEAEIGDDVKPFLFNDKETVSLVYARMRAVGESKSCERRPSANLH
jgi:hypothetical protein